MRFSSVLSLRVVIAILTVGVFTQFATAAAFSDASFHSKYSSKSGSKSKDRTNSAKRDREIVVVDPAPVNNDSDLVRAVNDRRNVNFVQGAGVVVTRVLPDDNSGLPHQRWYVKLSNGKEVIAIYNSDMGRRVPAQVGVVMAVGGEFKMTNLGPMIHWLHADPRGTRPDGYVIIQGIRYGGK